MKKNLRRGNLVWARLDGEGSEQRGIRPCIIIQNDTGNKYSQTTLIVPLTTRITKKKLPTHLEIPKEIFEKVSNRKFSDSIALTEQMRVIDKERILSIEGYLPKEVMNKLNGKMIISMGING